MTDTARPSAAAIAEAVRSRSLSPLEAVDAALSAIDSLDPALNATLDVRPDVARGEAERMAARLDAGEEVGVLAGVPILVKDLENAAGFRTTYGDPTFASSAEAAIDSVFVARLRAAGCIVVGKANTPAYGFHAETDNLVSGPTRNPWAASRTAGGSSGGSAAAVAAGMVPLATGSDGGGSIRIPSAACGLPGLKPTNGAVPSGDDGPPVWGPFSVRGPIAATFTDLALALDVSYGISQRDLASVEPGGSFVSAVESGRSGDVRGLRIVWSAMPGTLVPEPGMVAACREALNRLSDAGAEIDEVESLFPAPAIGGWLPRAAAGSADAIGDPDGWGDRFLPAATALAGFGRHVTAADLLAGEAVAHRCGLALADLFERFDVVVTPSAAAAPPRVGEPHPLGSGWAGDFTLPFNVTRSPAAIVPVGLIDDDGDQLPVALQLVGPRLGDVELLGRASAVDAVVGWHNDPPVCVAPGVWPA